VTTEQPSDVDSSDEYPSSWKTPDIRRREEAQSLSENERWLGSLSPGEMQLALRRARGGRS
jgi:hypothetical protein